MAANEKRNAEGITRRGILSAGAAALGAALLPQAAPAAEGRRGLCLPR